ncbi:MAG: DUF2029 domain-containing protein [Methanoregula sp.]|nr:DUF2029 domain-containing protein [Methanoregula sp.]
MDDRRSRINTLFVHTRTINRRSCLIFSVVILTYGIIAISIACVMQVVDTGGWVGVDADRFHEMARIIVNGFTPYVSFIDPKPPLLFFVVSAMDLVQPPGAMDLPVITLINILCALLVFYIGKTDYGFISGYTAGLLWLVIAAFVQGYFLFSEQFAVLFLLLSFIAARKNRFVYAGICLGLAFGFKQYAILGLVPLLYLMRASGEQRYHRLVLPAIISGLSSFAVVLAMYGGAATMSALYWTFGIAPAYVSGQVIEEIPGFWASSTFSFALYLVASIFIVLPVVLFAAASIVRRGLRSPFEWTIFLFALVLSGTLFIRQYLHYWILILPFILLLACREFADDADGAGDSGHNRLPEREDTSSQKKPGEG